MKRWAGIALVAAAAAVLIGSGLGGLGLWAPDEPRYAAVAEELRTADGVADRVLLHLNGRPYTQKPPLYFWLAALAGSAADRSSEFSARLPSAIAGVALVALTAWAGGRIFGGFVGGFGAAILLTTWDVAHLSRRVQLDVLLTLFTSIALFAYWLRDPRVARRSCAIFHLAMGLAVLTKGPVGWLIPVLVIVANRTWERWRGEPSPGQLRAWFPAWGLALSLGPGLVWVGCAVWMAPAGFFDSAVVDNLWGRFVEGTSHARPVYYYLYQFPVHFLPWTPLWFGLWAAGRRARSAGADPRRMRAWRFGLIWIGVTLAFFSASSGKRAIYLLPAFPAAALLCADAAVAFVDRHGRVPRRLAAGLAGVATALGVAALVGPPLAGAFGLDLTWKVAFATSAIAALAIGGWIRLERTLPMPEIGRAQLAWIALTVIGFEAVIFTGFMPMLDSEKSPREIARTAAAASPAGVPIGLMEERALVGALNFYAGRRAVELSTPDSLRRFLDSGGDVVVVAAKRLERVAAVAPVEIVARFRSGRRELLVLRAPRRVSPAPTRDAGEALAPRATSRSPRPDSPATPRAQTTPSRSEPAS